LHILHLLTIEICFVDIGEAFCSLQTLGDVEVLLLLADAVGFPAFGEGGQVVGVYHRVFDDGRLTGSEWRVPGSAFGLRVEFVV